MTSLDWWAGASPSHPECTPPSGCNSAPARNQPVEDGKVIFGAYPKWEGYPDTLVIVGVDGKEYVIHPSALLILPKVNAEILEKAGIGKILAPYVEPEKDFLEILREGDGWDLSNVLYQLDYDNPKLVLKAIQESAEYQLKAKLYDNPDQFFILKMLRKGINPVCLKFDNRPKSPAGSQPENSTNAYTSGSSGSTSREDEPAQPHKGTSTTMQNEDNELTDKGAISPEPARSGYLEQYGFDDFYEIEPINPQRFRYLPAFSGGLGNREVLNDYFETYGFNSVLSVRGRKFIGVKEVIDKDWAILEADYTKLETHDDYRVLMLSLGFTEDDLRAVIGFEDWECPNCGIHVFKPFVDAEERDGKVIVRSGRAHPVNKNSRTRKYAYDQLKKLELISKAVLERGLYVFRKGVDGEYRSYECSDKSLALIDLVLTIPEGLSKSLADLWISRWEKVKAEYGIRNVGEIRDVGLWAELRKAVFGDSLKILRKAVVDALREWLKWYLVEIEGYPEFVVKDLKLGDWVNLHIWGSAYVDRHVHAHVLMPNFVVCGGLFVRFNPYLTKSALQKLREVWAKHLKRALDRIEGLDVWLYEDDLIEHEEFVIYNKYIRLTLKDGTFVNAGRVVHKFKYNARKVHNDLNNGFWEGRLKLDRIDYEWIEVCLLYDNRTVVYGYIKDWLKIFDVDRVEWVKIVKAERKEICPFCGSEMALIDRVWLYDVLERFSGIVHVYYFNGHWYLDFWKKRDSGGGLNG